MSYKDITVSQLLNGVSLPAAAAALYFAYTHIVGLILLGDINSQLYHLRDKVIEQQGVAALYEARIADSGELSAADRNRYNTILSKIEATGQAILLLEADKDNL